MTRSLLTTVALAGLVALTGCADLGYLGTNGRNDDYRRGNDRRYEDYGRRGVDSRRIERDAAGYANELDRYLRISNREERAIRDLLVRRTFDHLDRRGAYPFPRRGDYERGFWNRVDRDIERVLDRRYREPYRYYNRYGARQYQDYYRYRRYDDRRGWYDTRTDRRREDARRDRQDDRRDDRGERRDDRREDVRQDRREDQREARQDRREDRRETREDRREQKKDRKETRRDRREDRRQDARPTRRQRGDARQDDDRSRREADGRRDRRRGNNED